MHIKKWDRVRYKYSSFIQLPILSTESFLLWSSIVVQSNTFATSAHCTITKYVYVLTRQSVYLKSNTEALSCNHCYGGKAMNITQTVCVCSLRYPACNAHAPFCRLCPVLLYNIFQRYLIKCTIFEKKIIAHKMCVLIFSRNLSETILTIRRAERDMIKNSY